MNAPDNEVPESFVSERRLFAKNYPERFERPSTGFRGAPLKVERQPSSTLHSLNQPETTTTLLDHEAAGFLREWK